MPEQVLRDLQAHMHAMQQELIAARGEAAQARQAADEARAAAPAQRESAVPAAERWAAEVRTIGKPEHFDGTRWPDWSVVFAAYVGATNLRMADALQRAARAGAPVLNATLEGDDVEISRQLHYWLVQTCRAQALDVVLNSGALVGLEAWRQLNHCYEPQVCTIYAGLLMQLLNWDFSGELLTRMEAFEREVSLFEGQTGEQLSNAIKIGIVLQGLLDSPLKQRMILNAERLEQWVQFREEIVNVRRAQAAAAAISGGPMPMELGGFGGKGGGKGGEMERGHGYPQPHHSVGPCRNCGRQWRAKKDCRFTDEGKGGGAGAGRGSAQRKCYKCNQLGHVAKDCEQREVAAVEGGRESLRMAIRGLFLNALDKGNAVQGACDLLLDSGIASEELFGKLLELGAVARGPRKLVMGVDSGAATTVMPKESFAGLASVSEVVDAGRAIVFGRERSFARNESTGLEINFARRNNVYEVELDAHPCARRAGCWARGRRGFNPAGLAAVSLALAEGSEICQLRGGGGDEPLPVVEDPCGELLPPAQPGEGGESEAEAPVVRAARGPWGPTGQEEMDHEVSHVPFRAWCRHCVAGRGRPAPREPCDRAEDGAPIIALDNAYLGGNEDSEDGSSPIRVVRDSAIDGLRARCCRARGWRPPLNVETLARLCAQMGRAKMHFRSDQEKPILALKESAVGESRSNGLAERAVRDVEGLARTLRRAAEELRGAVFGQRHPVLPWLVQHAGAMLGRGQRAADGRTPCELLKGRAFKKPLPAFSEKVFYLPAGKRASRLVGRWLEGIFLGVVEGADEVCIGAPSDKVLLAEMRGVPWGRVPGGIEGSRALDGGGGLAAPPAHVKIVADQVAPDAQLPEVPAPAVPGAPRRVYLRRDVKLQSMGVGQLTIAGARQIGTLLMQLGAFEGDIREVFNPGDICRLVPCFDLKQEIVMYLRTGWDFDDKSQRELAMQEITESKPMFVVASPVCTPFSLILKMGEKVRDEERYQALLRRCVVYLEFVMEICALQQCEGRYFLCVRLLEGVVVVKGHQCGFGQTSKGPDGVVGPVAKATGWMTNCPAIAKRVGVLCAKDHRHVHLVGGRSKAAERYPIPLVKAILSGMREQLETGRGLHAFEVGVAIEEPEAIEAATPEELEEFFDGISGARLDPKMVRAARADEMAYMERLGVFWRVPTSECHEAAGARPLPSGWVDTNTGDQRWPDAAQTFAAAPPLEGLRLLLSLAMSWLASEGKILMFLGISRARLHSELLRRVYLKAPAEDEKCGEDECWLLLNAMCGLRGAGAAVDLKVEKVMEELWARQGQFSPCVCRLGSLVVWRRGDDFVVFGGRSGARNFEAGPGRHLIVKCRGILGPEASEGDVKEIVVPNRILRWVPGDGVSPDRVEHEEDPRHVEIVLAQLWLDSKSMPVGAPGVEKDTLGGEELTGREREMYRSVCMRLAYLALDRPDLQFSAKEAARVMQAPTVGGWEALKRMGRYLLGAPRLVATYARQPPPRKLSIFTDSDFAGCTRTRKSTSAMSVLFGSHWIKSSSTTQQVQSLATRGAEFHALVEGASAGLDFRVLLEDYGYGNIDVELCCDATAGKGIAERRGVGRIRHLRTLLLWIQRAVQRGLVNVRKVPGAADSADLGTKRVEAALIARFLASLGFVQMSGASRLALKAVLALALPAASGAGTPAAAPLGPCPGETNEKSSWPAGEGAEERVEVEFVNESPLDVQLVWVSQTNQEQHVAYLATGAAHLEETFVGHLFNVRSAGGARLMTVHRVEAAAKVRALGIPTASRDRRHAPPPPPRSFRQSSLHL
ncbi:unnamed protein product [Prorocentrum cordatum]|uniref:CCHC-type domain-containing protein n=1 Tax=Prorocentrum cordatum TaxID=2364126 RepID=A0ABN9RK56_9DINO|nr:unnamed protein product [Polarella glacialis]